MTIMKKNGREIAIVDREAKIITAQDLLDLFAAARYEYGCDRLIMFKETLGEAFFDLKTQVAGEFLQKCSNYYVKLAIVGDFSGYTSKSLKDFIYECNKGNLVFFKNDVDSAAEALSRVK